MEAMRTKEFGKVQYKSIDLTPVEFDEEKKTVYVKFSTYNVKDDDDDILVKGVFTKSIKERGVDSSTNRKIAFLLFHDVNRPAGKILRFDDKDDGCYAFVEFFDNIPDSILGYNLLKQGVINQFSIGFQYIADKVEYDEAKGAFIVKEVKLFEVSLVSLGANEHTGVVNMGGKQKEEQQQKSIIVELSKCFNQEAEPPMHSLSMIELIAQSIKN